MIVPKVTIMSPESGDTITVELNRDGLQAEEVVLSLNGNAFDTRPLHQIVPGKGVIR